MGKFKLTKIGVVYIIFSILLLLYSFVYGEIFAAVCVIGLCLYFFLSFVAIAINYFYIKKNDFHISKKNNKITININKTPYSVFYVINSFYNFIFMTNLKDKNSRKLNIKMKLEKTLNQFHIPQNERGNFFLKEEYIELNDIANFFSFKMYIKNKTIYDLQIEPIEKNIENFKLPEILDQINNTKINIKRNDELYDTRPYFPGDDTRKINWQIYAHTNKLAIKQGDFAPPVEKKISFLVLEPITKKTSDIIRNKFDILINKAMSIAKKLNNTQIELELLFYDYQNNTFQREIIFVNDNQAVKKIKSFFCKHQVQILKNRGNQIHKKIIEEIKNKKNTILIFIMPIEFNSQDSTNLKHTLKSYKQKIVFYFGPKKSNISKLNFWKNFLFKTKLEKNNEKTSIRINSIIETKKSDFKNRGYYAYAI